MIGFPKPERTPPKARKPLPRGTWTPTRTPLTRALHAIARLVTPKATNPARQKREKVRAYGTKAHRDWLHAQLCVITNQYGTEFNPIVAAHTKGDGGAGYKSSARYQVPVLHSIHQEMHAGIQTFEARHGVSLQRIAAETYARFLAEMGELERSSLGALAPGGS